MIEDPRTLLLNQRSFCSVFLIFHKHNSPRIIRTEKSSIRLFHKKSPAIDFSQTKSLVEDSQNNITETVYQKLLNNAGWNYCNQRRRENTFNLENKKVLKNRQKDHIFFLIPLSINAKHPVLDQAIYGKIFTINYSAEQNYSTLHFKLDVFQLKLKKRRRKRKHEHSQTVWRKAFWLR